MQATGCLGYSMCFYFLAFSTVIGHKDCQRMQKVFERLLVDLADMAKSQRGCMVAVTD